MAVKLTQEMINGAKETENKYGVPASITLGQIMLESGGSYSGGLSGLAYNYNNLFGMTAGSSWTGKTVYMTNKNGTDGQYYRVYDSVMDSINDHGQLLTTSRYNQYTKDAKTVEDYAKAIKQAGYATDPDYVSKLTSIIYNYNLNQYNTGNWANGGTVESGHGGTGGVIPVSTGDSTEIKWWGDIIVIIISILLIVLAVVFFVLAFNGGSVKNVATKAINSATGGALKAVSKIGK